ncbi:MAG: iron donor protein CyaY [Burkholderiaceae bacterium]|nr:iron donor protein CyaY [Burkholderiaceae bacterium]
MTHTQPPQSLTDAQYFVLTSSVLDGIEKTVDAWLDADVIDIDTHRTGGLLELSFPDGSKIVINTQPPLHELWLASRSGGYHFHWADGQWLSREGREFHALLSAQASAQSGASLVFAAPQ